MKTPLKGLYLDKLAALNDQLCFYLFNREELNQKLANFSAKANALYTTDLFVNNRYSHKIYVNLKKLPEFQEKHETLNFGAYFSFSYEFFTGYIEAASSLIGKINGSLLTEDEQKNDVETRFKILIGKAGLGIPDAQYFNTLTYCRLRRNFFTHISDSLSSKFTNLIKDQGSNLNMFWSSAINKLDFSDNRVSEFKEIETIDLIKILRISLEEIDCFIANILNKEGVALYVANSIFSANPSRINADVIVRRKAQITGAVKRDFGLVISEAEIDKAAKSVARK